MKKKVANHAHSLWEAAKPVFLLMVGILIATCIPAHLLCAQEIGEIAESGEMLHEAKVALNFANVANTIANLSGLIADITTAYLPDADRYSRLSNKLAIESGWLSRDPAESDYIRLSVYRSHIRHRNDFSIKLSRIPYKECELLTSTSRALQDVTRIYLNGRLVFGHGRAIRGSKSCKSQWFFEKGKNTLQYVGY